MSYTENCFPFEPDWSDGIVERMEWMTDILRANNGNEQRIGVRHQPRVTLDLRYLLKANEAAYMRNLIWRRSFFRFFMPYWPNRAQLVTAETAGQTEVTITGDDYGMAGGAYLGFFGDEGREIEVREVASSLAVPEFGTTVVQLNEPLTQNWPARTTVVPVAYGYLDNDFSADISQLTPDVTRVQTQFLYMPNANPYPFETGSPDFMYQGFELFAHEPNWKQDIALDTRTFTRLIDQKVGLIDENSQGMYTWLLPERTQQAQWFLNGRSAIAKFRKFLSRRHGRLYPFWTPSWNTDFHLVSTIAAASTTLVTKVNHAAKQPGSQHIHIIAKNGTQWPCEVMSIVNNGNGTQNVVIDAPLGQDLSPAQVSRICWLNCTRLASDTVEFRWHNTNLVEARMSLAAITDRITGA